MTFRNRQPFHTDNLVRTLSKRGICSRKQAVEWVQKGRVQINGQVVYEPGRKMGPKDQILIDGKRPSSSKKRVVLLHKPAGFITTRSDEKKRKTVYDLLPPSFRGREWIFPVGRLDQDSEGLLIFTNDTELGNWLTDPAGQIPRTYEVWIRGNLTLEDLNNIRAGMEIGRGEKTRGAHVRILKKDSHSMMLQMVLTEGKNREIRRIFEILRKPVTRLIRTQFGPFRLGSLKSGEFQEIINP